MEHEYLFIKNPHIYISLENIKNGETEQKKQLFHTDRNLESKTNM